MEGLEFMELIQYAAENLWLLLFLSVWGIGHVVREKTALKNEYIPAVLFPVGVGLGLALIELSLVGGLVGMLVSFGQMGFYDFIKPFLLKKKGKE